MKELVTGLTAALLLLVLAAGYAAPEEETFTGEIMDSQCVILRGHELMIFKGEDLVQCTHRCVQIGGKYALFDAAAKKGYQLDDQKKAQGFAGAKVEVTGTYDASTKMIKVADIRPAS